MRIPRPALDVLDRAARTTLQQFIIVAFAAIPAVGSITRVAWYEALGVGIGAGILSILMSLLSWRVPVLPYWPDVAVRMARTFVQSLVASVVAGAFNIFTADWGNLLTLALAAAMASLATSLATSSVKGVDASASLVYDTTTQEAEVTGKSVASRDTPTVSEQTAQHGSEPSL